jgi:hypothetical protein
MNISTQQQKKQKVKQNVARKEWEERDAQIEVRRWARFNKVDANKVLADAKRKVKKVEDDAKKVLADAKKQMKPDDKKAKKPKLGIDWAEPSRNCTVTSKYRQKRSWDSPIPAGVQSNLPRKLNLVILKSLMICFQKN